MPGIDYRDTEKEHCILSIKNDGLVVSLDDGSVWNISPGDSTKSICWYSTMRVKVEESDSEIYPFILINMNTAGPDRVYASLTSRHFSEE